MNLLHYLLLGLLVASGMLCVDARQKRDKWNTLAMLLVFVVVLIALIKQVVR